MNVSTEKETDKTVELEEMMNRIKQTRITIIKDLIEIMKMQTYVLNTTSKNMKLC